MIVIMIRRFKDRRRGHFIERKESIISIFKEQFLFLDGIKYDHKPSFLNLNHQKKKIETYLFVFQPILRFEFQEEGTTIELTDYHLIYATNCGLNEGLKLKYAKDLKVNQCVSELDRQRMRLKPKKIAKIRRARFFNF